MPMPIYRCYFLDEGSHVKATETIDVARAELPRMAEKMLKGRPQHRAVEVWEGARCVYHADQEVATDS
jgi:hypothetical protein